MYYPATLTPHDDGSGRYDVTFVDLPGCVSQGSGLEQALQMAQEALQLHLSAPVIVERIDAVASELGLTRSGLIAVATREYCNRMQA